MSKGAVIVIIPQDAVEDEHCTLVYAGTPPVVTAPFDVMAEVCARMAMLFNPFPASVASHELFGGADDAVAVATLESPFLYTMSQCVEHFHFSQWGFRPHITALDGHPPRPVGSHVWMNRLALWYGDEHREWVLGVNRIQSPWMRPLGQVRM